jgi:hypothetical protein
MSANTYQETAKVYQFPVRPRHAIADRRGSTQTIAASVPQGVCDELDNCWYHGAAVHQTAVLTKS